MIKSKVCNKHDCRVGNKRQSIKNFRPVAGNTDGYSNQCKLCAYNARKSLASVNSVERTGNNEWMIDSMLYKLGAHDFVYYKQSDEWLRSTYDRNWLDRVVRNG